MLKYWMVALMIGLMVFPMKADDEDEDKPEKKGKAIITVFADAHSGFGDAKDDRGFDLDRAYLGYQYDLPYGLQLKAVVDFGRSDHVEDYQRIGYIKNALVTWKHGAWTLNGGLITTTQFKVQEDFWGKRYVMKSFQDEYSFGSSADLGVSVAYRFNDYVSADVIVVNGEGYKRVQVQDGLQYGAGVTVNPVEDLLIRVYGSYNESTERNLKGITNLAAFVGYADDLLSVAAEYNYQRNAKYVTGRHQHGLSAYATVSVHDKINVFGRWDYLASKSRWDVEGDGMAGIVGAEFKLGKYVKLAPNFRLWAPYNDDFSNSTYVYLNASFSL